MRLFELDVSNGPNATVPFESDAQSRDLQQEYEQGMEIARQKSDLAPFDAGLRKQLLEAESCPPGSVPESARPSHSGA